MRDLVRGKQGLGAPVERRHRTREPDAGAQDVVRRKDQ